MNIYQFFSGLRKCRAVRPQVCKNASMLKIWKRICLTIFIVAFTSGEIYGQHLFSVHYRDLPQGRANLIAAEVAKKGIPVSAMTTTRNRNGKEVYEFSLTSVQDTQIVILNEDNGRSVVITPAEGAPAQFELSPFFIEELRQAVLGMQRDI